jgi:hypothetical protein
MASPDECFERELLEPLAEHGIGYGGDEDREARRAEVKRAWDASGRDEGALRAFKQLRLVNPDIESEDHETNYIELDKGSTTMVLSAGETNDPATSMTVSEVMFMGPERHDDREELFMIDEIRNRHAPVPLEPWMSAIGFGRASHDHWPDMETLAGPPVPLYSFLEAAQAAGWVLE